MAAGTRARAAANGAVAAATETVTRHDAEEAEDHVERTEDAARNVDQARLRLGEAISVEDRALAGAVSATDALKAGYAHAQSYAENLNFMAAQLVHDANIAGELAPVFKGLQEWKMKVLYHPVQAGRLAGMKAAQPFDRAMMRIEERVGTSHQKADALSSEAKELRAEAKGIASEAVKKQAAGNSIDAQRDMAVVQHKVWRSNWVERESHEMQDDAMAWNEKTPAYLRAAQAAAQEAMHRYNPEQFAPPSLDLAHIPPTDVLEDTPPAVLSDTPPAGVLVQRGRHLRRAKPRLQLSR